MPIRSEIYRRWSREMRRDAVFRPGERVGVAVSGGPDSALLLDYMARLAEKMGLVVSVVHFNHHLRGKESDEDEKFVRRLAREGGFEFHGAGAKVAETARAHRRNLEATARELRYRYFLRLVSQGKLDKIVTAHTANDQAETVLMRLLRGTGTKGLGGIYPLLEGKISRPFLGLTRAEVEQEMAKRKLTSRLDSSNHNLKLRRNKIRLELLPLLGREYSPETVRLLADLAARARDDEAFLEEQARERAKPWRVREGGLEKIALKPLADFPSAVARRALRQMVQRIRGTLAGLTHRHIESLRRFASEGQSGHRLELPGGVSVRKEFDWLIISSPSNRCIAGSYSYPVTVPGEVRVPELGTTFKFKIVGAEENRKEYNEGGFGGLDPRKLGKSLILRNWRAGDRFGPAGSQKTEKLKELFRQRKIPTERRRLWPVLESSSGILWVRGFPPSREAGVLEDAREALVISESAPAPACEDTIEAEKKTR